MKKLWILVAAGAVACAAFVVPALAAGLWGTLPIVGGASYCAGTSTGVNGQVCTATVPAGPTVVTGNETIPMDTNLPSGQAPQTVKAQLRSLNAAPIEFITCSAAACGSHTVGTNKGGVLLSHTTTIDSATVVTPANPIDGQRFTVAADHTITTLTMTANTGSSFAVTAPAVLTASATAPQGYEFIYVASTTKWYRVH